MRSNYLNESEASERLQLDVGTIKKFARWNWLVSVKTTTGFLILLASVERLESEQSGRLAYAQLHCRKKAERRRLRATQRTLEL